MMELPGKTKRGRPKRRFMDAAKEDIAAAEVTEDNAEDRTEWRWKVHYGDPCRKKNEKFELIAGCAYVGAGLEPRVEDGFTLFVDEEGVDCAPLVVTQEVFGLLQCGVYPRHSYRPTTNTHNQVSTYNNSNNRCIYEVPCLLVKQPAQRHHNS